MKEQLFSKEIDQQPTRLWLMRHAPTEWNLQGKIQASQDFDIVPSETDAYFERVQAQRLQRPDIGIATPLRRTEQTLKALLRKQGWEDVPIVTEPAFRERNWGVFEGLTHAEIKAIFMQDPELLRLHPEIAHMDNMSSIIDEPDFRVEGSESMREVTDRVRPAIVGLRDSYPGQNILLVCHAGVLVSQGLPTKEISELLITKNEHGQNTFRVIPQ